MSEWLPFLLLGAGLLAIIAEIFIPAGGVLGLAGVVSIIAGIVLSYMYQGYVVGNIVLLCGILLVPLIIALGLKIFPKTFLGKMIILRTQLGKDTDNAEEQAAWEMQGLLGREGKTMTVLRPSGMIELDNKRYSVVTEGSFIEKGEYVEITAIEGSRILVKKVNHHEKTDSYQNNT